MPINKLDNYKVAILVADGFEQIELTEPQKALEKAGAKTQIVSPVRGEVQGVNHMEKGKKLKVDVPLDQARPEEFDALLLPGGVFNPDQLRMDDKALRFVKHFFEQDKPVAAICHGPWTLVETGVIRGKRLTSYESIKTDILNAGGKWVDEPVVADGNLVTSRKPDDLPAFTEKMLTVFAQRQPAISRR